MRKAEIKQHIGPISRSDYELKNKTVSIRYRAIIKYKENYSLVLQCVCNNLQESDIKNKIR